MTSPAPATSRLRLLNSLTRAKAPFAPADPSRVTMYVCGPTVYAPAHIGNARPAVAFDVLFRVLRRLYGEDAVLYARNLTDVDDKIIAAAADTGEALENITTRYAALYRKETAALGVLPPTFEPLATKHVDGMLEMIAALVAKGHAYRAESGVWFHVPSMESYGGLSGRALDDNEAGARVETLGEKRHPADFALWKAAKTGDPEEAVWDSPFGPGRPGWHIECSAMAKALLGETIDIHGGGIDLQFPHHENEIAQSECAHGAPLAQVWLHNGFLQMGGEKMSKSDGNVALIGELLERWPGEAVRLALISAHYRASLDWTDELLDQSKATLDRAYGALRRSEGAEDGQAAGRVEAALLDDLNTPRAIAELMGAVSAANSAADAGDADALADARAELLGGGALLGLLQQDPAEWEQGAAGGDDDRARIDALVAARVAARMARDWAEADRIRDALEAEGIELMDGSGGSSWRKR